MSVVNQQSDTWRFGSILRVELDGVCLQMLSLFLVKFLIEFDEQQSLVANICEEIIFPDEVKDVGPP